MTYAEFLRHLGKASLTVREFAELIKMSPNSVTNCARRGEVPSHLGVIVALMAALADKGADFKQPLLKIDIEPKKPRGAAAKGKFGGSRQTGLF